MSGPQTVEEWRRSHELAKAELESLDRRVAALMQTAGYRIARAAGFPSPLPDEIGRERERLVNAAEDAWVGLLRAEAELSEAAAERADEPSQPPRSGPELIATRAEVEAVRDQLAATGKPHGYKSIAKAGGWSVITVRRRLEGN